MSLQFFTDLWKLTHKNGWNWGVGANLSKILENKKNPLKTLEVNQKIPFKQFAKHYQRKLSTLIT